MSALNRIENFFGKDFNFVINKLHWKDGISLFELSNKCGVSRDVFQRECKKRNLKLMSCSEAKLRSNKCKGKNHWAFGLTKETSAWAKKTSERMKKNNPSLNKETREKISFSISKRFKNNLLPQEIKALGFISKLYSEEILVQHPVGSYIADFLLPKINVIIEIDSSSKWGTDRRLSAEKRDKILLNKGFKTIRINKNDLSFDFMLNVLKANNVI